MGKPTSAERIESVLAAKTKEEIAAKYDDWADAYEDDLTSAGYHTPALAAGFIARHVPKGAGPLLDFGAGTGVGGVFLKYFGYDGIVAVDGSAGMLEAARRKGVYDALHEVLLDGDTRLPFADDTFAGMTAIGILVPGHAPPEALDELVRVVKPGGVLVFNVSVAQFEESGFKEKLAALEKEGKWERVEDPVVFRSLPLAIATYESRLEVYRSL